jgi:hypothetical protein
MNIIQKTIIQNNKFVINEIKVKNNESLKRSGQFDYSVKMTNGGTRHTLK